MSKQTLQERYAAGLLAIGCTEVERRPGGQRCFKLATGSTWRYYFAGSNGSVRVNGSKAVSSSRACSDKFKEQLLAAAKFEKK